MGWLYSRDVYDNISLPSPCYAGFYPSRNKLKNTNMEVKVIQGDADFVEEKINDFLAEGENAVKFVEMQHSSCVVADSGVVITVILRGHF